MSKEPTLSNKPDTLMQLSVVLENEWGKHEVFTGKELRVFNRKTGDNELLIIQMFHDKHKQWEDLAVFRDWAYWRWWTDPTEFV